ncbi:hypothetical protein D3C81_469510 [compost metagenome]
MRLELHLRFPADTTVIGVYAVVVVGQAVDGTAVGHHQTVGTDRGDAAWQQIDDTRIAIAVAAERYAAQRSTQHAALVDGRGTELHRTEHAVRHRWQCGAHALDGERAGRVQLDLVRTPLVQCGVHADADIATAVDLRRRQGRVAR